MLDKIYNKLSSWMLVFMVVLVAGVMALQFGGPQAQGCGAQTGPLFAAKVYGETISAGEFSANFKLAGFNRVSPSTAQSRGWPRLVLDGLVDRSLLAREARSMGFAVSPDDAMANFQGKQSVFLTLGQSAPESMPSGEISLSYQLTNEGEFDLEGAKQFIRFRLGRSIREFAESQAEETLAQRMREVVSGTVRVSPREVWDTFVRERETATVKYIRFSTAYYRDTLEPTEAQLRSWMSEHEEELNQELEASRHRYRGLEKQVRARHILIRAEQGAEESARAEARRRAESLLARARRGEDFARLARAHSDDVASARRGGDVGYNPTGRMVAPFDEAQFSLAVGQLSGIVETRYGFHIIKVVGIREGDVPDDEIQLEIANRSYRQERSAALTEQAAAHALEQLRGGTDLATLERQLGAAADTETERERDPLMPQVQETRAFGRGDSPISGVDNAPLVRAAFELSTQSPVPDEPVRLGNDFFVMQLEDRTTAVAEDFTDDVRGRIRQGLLRGKTREALAVFIRRLRTAAEADGAIRVNGEILDLGGDDEDGGRPPARS